MAHGIVHLASALCVAPFSITASIGAIAPDVTWLRHEFRLRAWCRRHNQPAGEFIKRMHEHQVIDYRCAHSVIIISLVAFLDVGMATGMLLHVLLDLPTHDGIMRQRPLFPCPWRWPRCLILKAWRHTST